MKSKQEIFDGFAAELKRNLLARYEKNNNFINIISVSEEAVCFLLVNSILVTRQLGLPNTLLPMVTKQMMIEGMEINLKKFMPKEINDERIYYIVKEYERRIQNPDVVSDVNYHYNELFGFQGGNVIK